MKISYPLSIKPAILLVLFCAIAVITYAQNTPKIQVVSLRAPVNIKIDGKLTEWGDKLQAFNHINELWYTISNDDDNLYLTVLAPNGIALFKTIQNSLTFTVSRTTSKKASDNVTITYPVLKKGGGNYITMTTNAYDNFKQDTIANSKHIDSLVKVANTKAGVTFKELAVTGIKGVDSLISVYNTDGIKVAGQFTRKLDFVYELAIPLKYLGFSVKQPTPFSYNIQLNGFLVPKVRELDMNGNAVRYVTDSPPSPKMRPTLVFMNYPTDFWGEYTLAKK